MTTKKITDLTTGAALDGSELFECVQGGSSRKILASAFPSINYGYVTISSQAGLPNSRVLTAGSGISLTDGGPGSTITVSSTGVTGILPVANGGTGTTTPSIVAGTNISVTGTWPNQTINASGGGSGLKVATVIGYSDGTYDTTNSKNINSVSRDSTGSYTINFTPGFFTSGTIPVVMANAALGEGGIAVVMNNALATTDLTTNIVISTSAGVASDQNFTLYAIGL